MAASVTLAGTARWLAPASFQPPGKPNVLILVFDACSAHHLSLYGYSRETTPNLTRFAERACVYHRHHSDGNFTTSGTASMLTGLHPWTHRAFNYRGMIDRRRADRNLFKQIGSGYTRLAFTQNLWADILLSQFEADLDIHLPCDAFSHSPRSFLQPHHLPSDRSLAYYVFQDFLNLRVDDQHPYPGSLLVASADLFRALTTDRRQVSNEYPRGMPTNYDFLYENPSVFQGISDLVRNRLIRTQPYLAYIHIWSPHEPYNARREFVGAFPDDIPLPAKPRHPLAGNNYPIAELNVHRRSYDEFIADLDAEFGRLMSDLERAGALENTYVIVTSDHGELFERGEVGHASALMYAPVTHIPLVISAPGQRTRRDFHSLTSNVDLLPTLLHIAGAAIPSWVDGELLPGFGGTEDPSRSLFPMAAKDNPAFQPLERATFTLIKGDYELFYFRGYPRRADFFELYHLQEDPDELQDLFSKDITVASRMKDELLEAIHRANRRD
jgi:arylsulfatase A-like enzyme